MGGLATLVRNRKEELESPVIYRPTILPRIDEHLLLRKEDDRRDGCFHPSDLSVNFCPRAWCLYNYHPQGLRHKSSKETGRGKRILDNGTYLHSRVQRYFQIIDVLWGKWERLVGIRADGSEHWQYHYGWAPRNLKGEIDLTWRYAEVKLWNPERNVKGHTDGLLRLEGMSRLGYRYAKIGSEIKSIWSRGYRYLGPSGEDQGEKTFHRSQTHIYSDALEYMRRAGELVKPEWEGSDFANQPLEGFLLYYECKDTQEVSEFWVPFDQKEIDAFFATQQEKMDTALAYKRAVEAGEKPERYPRCRCPEKKKSALCSKFKLG